MSTQLSGPVHLNIQFQENLAPESGKIRGDNRLGSITHFSHARFTDVPGFLRWSTGGGKILNYLSDNRFNHPDIPALGSAAYDVAVMIMQSHRGLIVLGNPRPLTVKEVSVDSPAFVAFMAEFAEFVGFPIFCGAQSAQLRFQSAMVVPFGGTCTEPFPLVMFFE
jgi:2-succinyl-5-enolpyruvyl-6-hydroxy-3-cyclohexene-1-carboxylate synthase